MKKVGNRTKVRKEGRTEGSITISVVTSLARG